MIQIGLKALASSLGEHQLALSCRRSKTLKRRVASDEILEICANIEVLQQGPQGEEYRKMFPSSAWKEHLFKSASLPPKQRPEPSLANTLGADNAELLQGYSPEEICSKVDATFNDLQGMLLYLIGHGTHRFSDASHKTILDELRLGD